MDRGESVLSPEYTSAGLELLSFEYELGEDKEDTATSPETSPRRPTPSKNSYRTPKGTQVKQTPRKVVVTPSRKRTMSPQASPPTTKKSCGDAV
ncbi:unnamed protein product [Lactuca saligna]|uniref:Uncharacterized protein n=1 Tax=Lactuca saligna TaxID=75948 RepID=A0AA36A236_LACSI|nr:unnamed protein product [Lactuca saligna]